MENSKRKFWAREILIFWVSLLLMVVAYLITLGVTEIQIYFKNREVLAYNAQLDKKLLLKQAEIDSLKQIPEFVSNQVEIEENEELRKGLFEAMVRDGYYSKSFEKFKTQFCCDVDRQSKLHNLLKEDYDVGSFVEFQEKLFGDYQNQLWEVSQKEIEQGWKELSKIRDKKKHKWTNVTDLRCFGFAWFLIVYPLRGIVFSILWALRTVKEK